MATAELSKVEEAELRLRELVENGAPEAQVRTAQKRLDKARADEKEAERHEAERAELERSVMRDAERARIKAEREAGDRAETLVREAPQAPVLTLTFCGIRVTCAPEKSGDPTARLAAYEDFRRASAVSIRALETAVNAARQSA